MEDIIGSIAAVLSTVSFVPQVIKVLRHKDTKAISLLMYLTYTLACTLWMVFGILIDSWPVIIPNALILIMSIIIIIVKVKNEFVEK